MRKAFFLSTVVLCLTAVLTPAALAAEMALAPEAPQVCYPTAITRSDDGSELKKLYDLGPEDDPAGFVDTLDLPGWVVGRTAEGVTAYGPAGEAFAFPFGVKPVYGADGVYRFCRWDMRSGDVLVDETGRDLAAGYRSIEWLADFPGGPVLLAKSDRTVSLLTLDGGTLWQKDYLPGGGPYA